MKFLQNENIINSALPIHLKGAFENRTYDMLINLIL